MDKKYVEDNFLVGEVEKEYYNVPLLTWVFRLIYLAVGGYAFCHSVNTQLWQEKLVDYVVLLLMLWRISRQSSPLIFLGTKGIVIRRRPMELGERISSFWEDENFYMFFPYEQIIGFTEDWDYLHVGIPEDGGILVIPIDLQYLRFADKMEIINGIRDKSHD